MHRVTVRTSTIFIAKRGRTQVFRSVDDVPPKLRKELEVWRTTATTNWPIMGTAVMTF